MQPEEVKRQNRRRGGQDNPPIELREPTFGLDACRPSSRTIAYANPTGAIEGMAVRAVEAAHLLGSASLEATIEANGQGKALVFPGDIDPCGAPLHREPTIFGCAGVMLLRPTRGGHDHPLRHETVFRTCEAIDSAGAEWGDGPLVPTFAIGRSQLRLQQLAGASQRKAPERLPARFDTLRAMEATETGVRHAGLIDDAVVQRMNPARWP